MKSNDNALATARACAKRMYDDDEASRALGITVHIPEPGHCEARMTIRRDMVNGHDICHGGFIFTLADSAFAFACNSYNDVTVAAAANIDFLRPAALGDELVAIAKEASRSRRTGIYDIKVSTSDGKAIALFRGRSASLGKPML